MLKSYLDAISDHINENIEDLTDLKNILVERNLTRIERKGAERTLQKLIEACIGLSKHWLKYKHKTMPSEAYDTLIKMSELGKITANDLTNWKKVIGMRNAIVHDYLNLDPAIMINVIKQEMYMGLRIFAEDLIADLRD